MGKKKDDLERVEIPLSLFKGNMDVLLEHAIPCNSIHLIRDPNSAFGVLLMIAQDETQKVAARAVGFRTASMQ